MLHYRSVFTARRYDSAVYAVVVYVFVGLSVTRRYCTKTVQVSLKQRRRIAQGL